MNCTLTLTHNYYRETQRKARAMPRSNAAPGPLSTTALSDRREHRGMLVYRLPFPVSVYSPHLPPFPSTYFDFFGF